MVNASCLRLYKACSVTCTQTEPPGQSGVREEWGLNSSGNSGPVMGNSSLCFLEVLPPTTIFLFLLFFFFFKNKSGLKEATKRLCFLLVERRHGFNSLTSSPHTTAQTYGAAGDRGVQDVPGFPLLNPLASPCPGSPTSESPRPLSGPAPRAGGLRRAGPEEVRTGPRLWLRSPLFFLRLLLQHVKLPKRQTQGSFPQ